MNTVKRRIVSLMVWVVLALGAVYGVMWQKDTSEQEREQW